MSWPASAEEFICLDPEQRADVLLEGLANCPENERGRNFILFALQRWFPSLQGLGAVSIAGGAPAPGSTHSEVEQALEDAYALLESRTLIVRDPRAGNSFCRLSERGQQRLRTVRLPDADRVRFAQRALEGLELQQPLRDRHVDSHFSQGKYETALRDCATYIEHAVRTLGGFTKQDIGVRLMSAAFAKQGPLADPHAHPGQQVGTQRLFEGFFGGVRNLISHMDHRYSDPKQAFQLLMLADLLTGYLEDAAGRMGRPAP